MKFTSDTGAVYVNNYHLYNFVVSYSVDTNNHSLKFDGRDYKYTISDKVLRLDTIDSSEEWYEIPLPPFYNSSEYNSTNAETVINNIINQAKGGSQSSPTPSPTPANSPVTYNTSPTATPTPDQAPASLTLSYAIATTPAAVSVATPQSAVPAQNHITPEVQYTIPQPTPTQQVTVTPSSDLTQKLYALSLSGIKLGETLEEVLKNPLFQPGRQVGWFSFPTNPNEIQRPKTDVIDEYKRLKSIASDDSQDPDIRSYLDGNSEFKILKAPIKFVQVVFKYDISKEKYAVTSIEVILNIPIQYSEEIYTASVIETLKNQLGVEQQLTDRKVPFWGDGSDDSTTPCLEFRNTSLELRESKVVQKRLSDNLAQALKTAKSRMEQAAGPIGEKVQ